MISMFLWVVCHPVISFAQIKPLTKVGVTRAVVVGVSDYQDDGIGDLQFAHRDAAAFEAYLRSPTGGALPDEHLFVLINEAATRAQFGRALDWLLTESKAGDKAIIYFSGHGDVSTTISEKGFLLLWDAIPQVNWDGGAMSLFDVKETIATMSVDTGVKTILIIDACKSGKIKYSDPTLSGKQKEIQNKNEITLFSCQPSELSHEGLHWGDGRGVFSYYLVEGLYGKADINADGVVNVNEIRNYVKTNVAAQIHPKQQTPEVVGIDEFPLAHVDNNPLASNKPQHSSTLETFHPALPRGYKEDRMIAHLDTNERNIYYAYRESLKAKRFFEPAGDCADDYFKLLMANEHLAEWHNHLRYDYAALLQDDAQQIINKIIKVNLTEVNRARSEKYKAYNYLPKYLDRAAEIIGYENYRYSILKDRSALFSGILTFMETVGQTNTEINQKLVHKFSDSIIFHRGLAHYYLSNIYSSRLNQPDSAIEHTTQAMKYYPEWPLPYANLAYNLIRYNKEYDRAKIYLDSALAIDSTHAIVWTVFGAYYNYLGDYIQAANAYRHILSQDSLNALTWANLSAALMHPDTYKESEMAILRSLEIDPNLSASYYILGCLKRVNGNNKEAERNYIQSLALNPNRINVRDSLVQLYLDQEQYQRAEEQIISILNTNSSYANAYYARAIITAQKKDEIKSIEYLKAWLQFSKADPKIILNDLRFEKIRKTTKFVNFYETL